MNCRIKSRIAIATAVLAAIFYQHLAVLVLNTGYAVTGGGMTSGGRARHIERLMRWGNTGKSAARRYALRFWGEMAPREYGVNVLTHAEHAFLGLSETNIVSMLGNPTASVITTNGTRELVYSSKPSDFFEDGKNQVNLTISVLEDEVVGMEASQQFWIVNENGEWIEQE
jgi:hypothetical protein